MSAVYEDLGFTLQVETKVDVRTETIRYIPYAKFIKLIVHSGMSMLIIVLFTLEYTKL